MRRSISNIKTHFITVICVVLLSINYTSVSADELTTDNLQQTEFRALAKQVLNVMDKWARSWAQLDPVGYVSSYSPDYVGKGFPSHFAWAANRQQRLQQQQQIQLSLTDVSLRSTKQGYFTVTFTQKYTSDTYKDVTDKKLEFKLIDGQWYIVAEKILTKK